MKRKVDVFDWRAAFNFGHLLLPCATAEVSARPNKGTTRLCFPFINTAQAPNPEDAIASLCALTWTLAFILDRDSVATARPCRIPHKMRITEADGDLWFHKGCSSARIATAIRDDGKNMLFMYLVGGAVDHEQSYLLSGLVAICNTWR